MSTAGRRATVSAGAFCVFWRADQQEACVANSILSSTPECQLNSHKVRNQGTIVDQLLSRRNVPQPPPALSARLSVPNLPRGVMDLGGAAANDPFAGGFERPGTSPLRAIFSNNNLVGLNTQGNMRQGVIDEDDENGGETQHSA